MKLKSSLIVSILCFISSHLIAQTINERIKSKADKIAEQKVLPASEVSKTLIDSTYLFVIDGKIYQFQSPEFKKISKDSLIVVNRIEDLASDSRIKNIVFLRRKRIMD